MARSDSALDPGQIARARKLLDPPATPVRAWPALAAATLLAVSSLTLATAMVLAPPVVTQHVVLSLAAQHS